MKRLENKGISTMLGSILFLTIVLTLASTLFGTLYEYGYTYQSVIKLEQERIQEKIGLQRLETRKINGTEYVFALLVNNTGSITSRIRAIYIDDRFLCDPSDSTINPNGTSINARDSKWILAPVGISYEPMAKIGVSTERGIKSIEYEYILKQGGWSPSYSQPKFYYGPLELNFSRFYYVQVDSRGLYNSSEWKPGWSIQPGTGNIAWNLTVKNVDDRNITIDQFSCLTLWPNDEPSNRRAWYLCPAQEPYTQFIVVNQSISLIYIWSTPIISGTKPQSIYSASCTNKVFLTFTGLFHEYDGKTTQFGQTIPFESVICGT